LTGSDGLISNNLTSVFQSSSKFIWITTFNGILRFDGINFKLFDKKTLTYLSSNSFYSSFEDSKADLWFASQSSGIVKSKKRQEIPVLLAQGSSQKILLIIQETRGLNFKLTKLT